MKAKQVCKLQENLAKEAIAYLMLYGTAVDVTPYRKAVTQVGTAWGLPIPDTQRWLDLIRQEENRSYPSSRARKGESCDGGKRPADKRQRPPNPG